MEILRILGFLAGLVIVGGTIFSAIETFVLPRSAQDRITLLVFLVVRAFFTLLLRWAKDYQDRDRIMSFYAPIALLMLFAFLVCLDTPGVWPDVLGNRRSLVDPGLS